MDAYARISGTTPDSWNPFDPDALGALIEAYTWISQPKVFTSPSPRSNEPGRIEYSPARYDNLTEMLRRAIARAQAEAVEQRKAA